MQGRGGVWGEEKLRERSKVGEGTHLRLACASTAENWIQGQWRAGWRRNSFVQEELEMQYTFSDSLYAATRLENRKQAVTNSKTASTCDFCVSPFASDTAVCYLLHLQALYKDLADPTNSNSSTADLALLVIDFTYVWACYVSARVESILSTSRPSLVMS